MDESEFVVVDEEQNQELKLAVARLNEVEQAYRNAQDALVRSNILLKETLDLSLELALKTIPPDHALNADDLTKNIGESMYTCTEPVLRDHVKSLCSNLVAVKANYEKLAEELKNAQLQASPSPEPQLEKLAGIFDQIDVVLPPATEKASGENATNVEQLCSRAEGILDRVKMLKEQENSRTTAQPVEQGLQTESTLGPTEEEYPGPSTEKPPKDMDISKMIREQVSSVLQLELPNIMSHQKELIHQALQPLAEQLRPAPQTTRKPEETTAQTTQPQAISAPNMPAEPVFANASEHRPMPPMPPMPRLPPVVIPAPTVRPAPMAKIYSSGGPSRRPGGNDGFVEVPTAIPSMDYPTHGHHEGPPKLNRKPKRHAPPSFSAEQEDPVCPNCNVRCADRLTLEAHIERCIR